MQAGKSSFRIYLVDDDQSALRGLSRLLDAEGFNVQAFQSPAVFLETVSETAEGCLIVDLRMPEMDGLQLHTAMQKRGMFMPVIFLTGHATVPASVRALKGGAVNFLSKPVLREDLLPAIEEAVQLQHQRQGENKMSAEYRHRFLTLTPREREVCLLVTEGRLNKQIAYELGAAEKTVKIHRARVMEKMQADSVADLVRMVDNVKSQKTWDGDSTVSPQ